MIEVVEVIIEVEVEMIIEVIIEVEVEILIEIVEIWENLNKIDKVTQILFKIENINNHKITIDINFKSNYLNKEIQMMIN